MFHIKNDKRSQRSAALVVGGLKKCLESKKFEDVTVTDIQKASTVGRATFYRLFDRTEDVLAYCCDAGVRRIISELLKSGNPTMKRLHEYMIEYSGIYELIMASRREHILYNCLYKYKNEIASVMKTDPSDDNIYFTSILTGIVISVVGAWINNGRKETADELNEYIYGTLGQLVKLYENKADLGEKTL